MRFFSNSELTDLYGVSDKAIRNWILAAQQNRISLDLYENKGRFYIADTIRNVSVLEELVEKGKKFRNRRTHKDIYPTKGFYDVYSSSQIIDIIDNLNKYRELPNSYLYFGKGATYWEAYLDKLLDAGNGNLLTNTIEVIRLNMSYIESLVAGYDTVNIINVCVGTCAGIRNVVSSLIQQNKMGRLICVDISPDMLRISQNKMKEWFGDNVQLETYVRDISYQRFGDILNIDSFGSRRKAVNLIFFVAGPIVNFRDPDQPLNTIRDSMGRGDLLITTLKRDTEETRRFFDFNIDSDKNLLSDYDRALLDLLNIHESTYDFEQSFHETNKLRSIKIYPRFSFSIHFTVNEQEIVVDLTKGKPIMLWRSWHHTDQAVLDRFKRTRFNVIQTTKSLDENLNMLIAKVQTEDALLD